MIESFTLIIKRGDKHYCLARQYRRDGWDYFLTNEEGEGMSLSEINLFDIIDEHFKETF